MSDPIVLVHGIFGFNQLKVAGASVASYFRNIPEALRTAGYDVPEPPQLNPAGSVSERAGDLKRYLDDAAHVELCGRRVHLIAHSMGGLDARYMISQLGMADRVLSLTTIGTPHRGSPIADLVVRNAAPALEVLVRPFLNIHGIGDLTTARCAELNGLCPEAPQVRYYSIAGRYQPTRVAGISFDMLSLTQLAIEQAEGENDGLVSTASAAHGNDPERWTRLGTWDANHFREVNWGTNIGPLPAEFADRTIEENYAALAARVVGDAVPR